MSPVNRGVWISNSSRVFCERPRRGERLYTYTKIDRPRMSFLPRFQLWLFFFSCILVIFPPLSQATYAGLLHFFFFQSSTDIYLCFSKRHHTSSVCVKLTRDVRGTNKKQKKKKRKQRITNTKNDISGLKRDHPDDQDFTNVFKYVYTRTCDLWM